MIEKPQLRIALIGGGHFGKYHAEKFGRLPGVEWVGCCDPEIKRAHLLAEQWKGSAFTRVDDLPDDLDAVSIAAPARLHGRLAKYFLECGVHVLVEKPLAMTMEEGRDLLEIAAANGLLIQVNHQERYFLREWGFPEVGGLFDRIEVERLGPPPPRPSDCSVILDILIHDLDWIRALLPDRALEVEILSGERGANGLLESVRAKLHAESGVTVEISGSRLSGERQRRARIGVGSDAVAIDFVGRTVEGFGVRRISEAEELELYGAHPFDGGDYVGKSLAHFASSVRCGSQPLTGGLSGLRALETALALEAAARCIT